MQTVFDWITIGIFSGLIVLLMNRSLAEEPSDSLWQYMPPSIGCALANYLGNEGYTLGALAVLAATTGYIIWVLRPFPIGPRT